MKRLIVSTLRRIGCCFCIVLYLLISSCKEELVEYNDNNCKINAGFISKLGFDPLRSYFSTSEKLTMGLVLIEVKDVKNLSAGNSRQYQDSSWTSAGWLAPIQIDNKGNIFTSPAPFISVLKNPLKEQNTVYKVDAATGTMSKFITLPAASDSTNNQNPFGIMAMLYACESNSLYVSTVAGSDRLHEKGAIYQLDASTGKVLDIVKGGDVLGMGISYITGQRRLYFGMARNSDVYSLKLEANGNFSGFPKLEFSLVGLGERGNDKVRRIKLNKDGSLLLYGMEFNFNLIAANEKKEMMYHVKYDEETQHWVFIP